MPENTQSAEAGLPNLLRKVLQSPHSELAIKNQMLTLAMQNLHIPEVTTALLEALPVTKDKETRDRLLQIISSLNTSRFPNLEPLYTALINIFREEKDRSVRTMLLERLRNGLHQDSRLAPFFLEVMGKELLSEPERILANEAISKLPAITEETALLALQRCVNAPSVIQQLAFSIAKSSPTWGEKIVDGLFPYLDVKVERDIRFGILEKLAEAKTLTASYIPLLSTVLRNDPEVEARRNALDLFKKIKPWNALIVEQLLWTSLNDSSEEIRSIAVALRKEIPELTNEQLVALANQLSTDRSAGVRLTILEMLKPVVRIAEVRTAIAQSFANNPSVFADEEFNELTTILSPYVGREESIRSILLKSVENLPSLHQRKTILQLVIPKVKMETVLNDIIRIFQKERDEDLRATLFQEIKGLSITKNPELVQVFCSELVEPSSPFRQICAGVLSTAAELYPEIPTALEDVLRNDQERELIRVCLDGYLRPKVQKQFDVLLEVIKNEIIDTTSRQRCLDEIMKMNIEENQSEQLANVLAGLKPNTLKK